MKIPYDLLDKWSKIGNNGLGPKMPRNGQEKIAKLAKSAKYNALYRGTVIKKAQTKNNKLYTIPRLQSWTTNKNIAIEYATKNGKSFFGDYYVVFYTDKNTNKIKSYKLNNQMFPNRNIEVIINRPIFRAKFSEKTFDNGIFFVPIEFIKSHNNPIVPNSVMKNNNGNKSMFSWKSMFGIGMNRNSLTENKNGKNGKNGKISKKKKII